MTKEWRLILSQDNDYTQFHELPRKISYCRYRYVFWGLLSGSKERSYHQPDNKLLQWLSTRTRSIFCWVGILFIFRYIRFIVQFWTGLGRISSNLLVTSYLVLFGGRSALFCCSTRARFKGHLAIFFLRIFSVEWNLNFITSVSFVWER